MGRFLMLMGLLVVAIGFVIHFKVQIPYLTDWVGKLPGDLVIRKGNATIYVPLATSFVCSIVLSILLSLFFKSSK